MSKGFLSHNHADKPFTRRPANNLRQAGNSVWIDEAEINMGDSLIGKIREGLDEVDLFAAVLSKHSIGSVWVQRELEITSNREIKERRVVVLPMLVRKVSLPDFLEGKFYVDFTDLTSYKPMFELLLRAVGPATPVEKPADAEIEALRGELAVMKDALADLSKQNKAHQHFSLMHKSPQLAEAVERANENFRITRQSIIPMHLRLVIQL